MDERNGYEVFTVVPWYRITGWGRQWYIQMDTLSYEFDLPYVFKSERMIVGNYAVPKMIGYVVEKKVVSV